MKTIILSSLLLLFTLSSVYGEKDVSANQEKSRNNQATLESRLKGWLKKIVTSEDKLFTPEEKEMIKKHLKGSAKKRNKFRKKSLPPGLAKKLARGGTLPPGWQMKVERGEVMDYEIYKSASPLPEELLRKLSSMTKGTILLKVGDKVVKVIEASRKIVDLFEL